MARAAPEEPTDVDGPPWVDEPGEESMPEPPEEGVQTSRRVVEIPVREASLSPRVEQMRDPSEPVRLPELVITPEGDFWFELVQQMVKAEVVTALVRELALQSQLVARDADQWLLRVERESLNQPSTRERLSTALQSQGHAVRLAVEIGPVSDSSGSAEITHWRLKYSDGSSDSDENGRMTSDLWSRRSSHAVIQFEPASRTARRRRGYVSKIPRVIIDVKATITSSARKAKPKTTPPKAHVGWRSRLTHPDTAVDSAGSPRSPIWCWTPPGKPPIAPAWKLR